MSRINISINGREYQHQLVPCLWSVRTSGFNMFYVPICIRKRTDLHDNDNGDDGAGTTCIAPYSSDGPLPASNVAPWYCALTRSRKPGPLRSGRSNGCATACGGSARKLNVILQPLGQSCGALPSSRLAYQDRQSMPSFNFHFEKGRLSFPVVTKHTHHLLLLSC